jgi:hypothetical protein
MADASMAPQSDPLAGLIDMPLPAPPSLWPHTWTARITLVLAAAALIAGIWRLAQRWRANRYRRAATAELDAIENAFAAGEQPAGLATELALLVRRTALSAFPRAEIAALAGPEWLAFLDRSYGGHEFSAGPGRGLEAAAYQPTPVAKAQVGQLIDLVRRWIRTHHD